MRLQPRRDRACTLDSGDWVEVGGYDVEQAGVVGTLARIADILCDDGTLVGLTGMYRATAAKATLASRPCWDQRSGATVPVSTDWFELEAGIEVRFSDGEFPSGDYWTVPARPGTRPIEWPEDEPPCGIEHRLCPLALVTWAQAENRWKPMIQDCRRPFSSLTDIHEELDDSNSRSTSCGTGSRARLSGHGRRRLGTPASALRSCRSYFGSSHDGLMPNEVLSRTSTNAVSVHSSSSLMFSSTQSPAA